MSDHTNKNLIATIQKTQQQESELLRTLPSDPVERSAVLDEIEELSKLRIELLTTLFNNLSVSENLIEAKSKMMIGMKDILVEKEKELNEQKEKANNYKEDHDKTLRLIEITRYESARYAYLNRILRLLSIVVSLLLVVVIIHRIDILPSEINVALFLIILMGGIVYLYMYISDYMKRDRHNFSQYVQTINPVGKNYETVWEHDRKLVDQVINDITSGVKHLGNTAIAHDIVDKQQKNL